MASGDIAGWLVTSTAAACCLLSLLVCLWGFCSHVQNPEHANLRNVLSTTWVLINVLLAAPPAIWLTASQGSEHLRLAAVFAMCNWLLVLCHAFGTVSNADTFFFSQERDFPTFTAILHFAGVAWGMITPASGFHLSLTRLMALERSSMRFLGFGTVMRLLWPLTAAAGLAGMLFMMAHVGQVPQAYIAFLVLAGLLIPCALGALALYVYRILGAQRLVAMAVASAPAGKVVMARQALSALRFELTCMAASALTTVLSFGWTAARLGLGLGLTELGFHLFRGLSTLDLLSNDYYALSLSGALSGAKKGTEARWRQAWRRQKRRAEAKARRVEATGGWQQKVEELAGRGITLEALLAFYKELPEKMPAWDPGCHSTEDVVRQALIPLSEPGRCAAAEVLMQGKRTLPKRMVTHAWSNVFRDLVAGVLADALGEGEFTSFAKLLDSDMDRLQGWVARAGVGGRAYWICAFSVNQHLGICGGNHMRKDSVTGKACPKCSCGLEKAWNDTAPLLPDGRSVPCEMNKFDDMMRFLSSSDPEFSQVFSVDANFETFGRAWCIAELATAHEMGMEQSVKIRCLEDLELHENELHGLRIQEMQASRPEDKEAILASIADHEAFNAFVQKLLFEELLPAWSSLDARERMTTAGCLLRWQETSVWAQEAVQDSKVSV